MEEFIKHMAIPWFIEMIIDLDPKGHAVVYKVARIKKSSLWHDNL
jgi:hypothetical protein